MANDLNDHVGIPGRPFTPEGIQADGFGPLAAFTALVAEFDRAWGNKVMRTRDFVEVIQTVGAR